MKMCRTLYETFWPLLFLRRRLRDGKARYRHLERLYGHTIIFPHEPVHRPVHRFAHGNIDDVSRLCRKIHIDDVSRLCRIRLPMEMQQQCFGRHSESITALQSSDRMAAKYCMKYMVKKYAEGEIEDDDGDGPPPLQSSSEDEDESQGEDGHGEICSEALKVLADSSSA